MKMKMKYAASYACLLLSVHLLLLSQSFNNGSWESWTRELYSDAYAFRLKKGENIDTAIFIYCRKQLLYEHEQTSCQKFISYYLQNLLSRPYRFSPSNITIPVYFDSCRDFSVEVEDQKYKYRADFTEDEELIPLLISCSLKSGSFDNDISNYFRLFLGQLKQERESASVTSVMNRCMQSDMRFLSWASLKSEFGDLDKIYSKIIVDDLPISKLKCHSPYSSNWERDIGLNDIHPIGSCLVTNLYLYNGELFLLMDDDPSKRNDVNYKKRVRLDTFKYDQENKSIFDFRTLNRSRLESILTADREKLLQRQPCARLIPNFPIQSISKTHVAMARTCSVNHGHFLFDGVIPVMWVLSKFNLLEDFDNQIVFMDDHGPRRMDNRFKLISDNAPKYFYEAGKGAGNGNVILGQSAHWNQFRVNSLCPINTLCYFKRFILGLGGFGNEYLPIQNLERGLVYQMIRNLSYSRSQQHSDQYFSDSCKLTAKSKLVIVQRLFSRRFKNLDEIIALLKVSYNFLSPIVVDFEDKSWEYQVNMMHDAVGVIAVDGAGIDNSIFLTPCAFIIVIGRDIEEKGSRYADNGFAMHTKHYQTWNQWLQVELVDTPPGSGYVVNLESLNAGVRLALHRQNACLLKSGCVKSQQQGYEPKNCKAVVLLNGSFSVYCESMLQYNIGTSRMVAFNSFLKDLESIFTRNNLLKRLVGKSVTVLSSPIGFIEYLLMTKDVRSLLSFVSEESVLNFLVKVAQLLNGMLVSLPSFSVALTDHFVHLHIVDVSIIFVKTLLPHYQAIIPNEFESNLDKFMSVLSKNTRLFSIIEWKADLFEYVTVFESTLLKYYESFRLLGYVGDKIYYEALRPLWLSAYIDEDSFAPIVNSINAIFITPSHGQTVCIESNIFFNVSLQTYDELKYLHFGCNDDMCSMSQLINSRIFFNSELQECHVAWTEMKTISYISGSFHIPPNWETSNIIWRLQLQLYYPSLVRKSIREILLAEAMVEVVPHQCS